MSGYCENVAVEVWVSGKRYCSNACPYIETPEQVEASPAWCALFLVPLRWDRRRRVEGYMRVEGCVRIRCHESPPR